MIDVKDGKLSDITPDANNANLGTQRGLGMLESSLRKHGAGRSILLDRKGRVIAGNKTVEQAGQIGLDELIIVKTDGTQLVAVQREDLDLADDSTGARELAYADNRVGELDLAWNPETILADLNADIDLSGLFRKDELSEILGELGKNGQGEPPEITETEAEKLAKEFDVHPGQVWQLGRHIIACVDSLNEDKVKELIGSESVAMIWSDPPYGISIVAAHGYVGGGELYDIPFGGVKNKGLGSTYGPKPFGKEKPVRGSVGASNVVAVGKYAPVVGDETTETAKKSFELLFGLYPESCHIWWGGNYYTDTLPPSPGWIVWDKDNTGHFADCELAWTNQQRAARIFEHRWNGMLKASEQGQRRVHPTQKPIVLAENCFQEYGNPDDLIFDPFLGSGISVLAAESLKGNRRVIGCELMPEYIAVTIHRWEQTTNQKANLTNA